MIQPFRTHCDTDPNFQRMYQAKLASMAPPQKIERLLGLSQMAAQFVCAGIKQRYPGASEKDIKIRYAAIVCGRDFVLNHFNWDPELQGY